MPDIKILTDPNEITKPGDCFELLPAGSELWFPLGASIGKTVKSASWGHFRIGRPSTPLVESDSWKRLRSLYPACPSTPPVCYRKDNQICQKCTD